MSLLAPSAAHPTDLSICRMTMPERLVTMSFRLWALPFAHPEQSHPDWYVGFRALGLEHTALALFNPLMETIFSSTLRVMEVHQLKCCGVSTDEELFLRCIALYQHQKSSQAELILADWLPPAAARIAASLASRLAAALEAAQLSLVPRPQQSQLETQRVLGKLVASGVGHGLSLIH